jgi:hypothetical protein
MRDSNALPRIRVAILVAVDCASSNQSKSIAFDSLFCFSKCEPDMEGPTVKRVLHGSGSELEVE